MLIKERDDRTSDVQSLRNLLNCRISAKQRFLIEREIKTIGSGVRGEDNSAYYIDYRYRDSENYAILHDLRLEHRGFVAQIDHLLINRLLHVYVLESKNYSYGVKISPEGEFLVWNNKTYIAIESPIEQNKRHVELLEKVFELPGFLPTRLGVSIPPSYFSYVLVAPNSRVVRPARGTFDASMVIKADALVSTIDRKNDSTPVAVAIPSLLKVVSTETLEAFARKLARLHRPAKIDFAAKFGVSNTDVTCPRKQAQVVNTQEYGKGNSAVPKMGANEVAAGGEKAAVCEKCGAAVDRKVVFYCRLNKEKFGGKTLCRSCQKTT